MENKEKNPTTSAQWKKCPLYLCHRHKLSFYIPCWQHWGLPCDKDEEISRIRLRKEIEELYALNEGIWREEICPEWGRA